MKKSLLWVVLLGFAFSFNACKDDDDPIPPIVGTWARVEYEFTELPTGFTKYWEGYSETSILGEGNYILVFKGDGTYARTFTLPSPYNLNDTGKYTLDGTSLKLAPGNNLELIDDLFWPGTEFSVSGDISDIRLTLTRVVTLNLPSDAKLDAVDGDISQIESSDREPIDVTVVYKFDKVQN